MCAYRRYRLFPDDIIVSGRCGEGRRGAGGIHPFKSVVYKPEKAICGKLEGLKFIRSERGGHTKNYSDIELMGILSDYFKYNSYITRLELERVCGMTRSTAYRRIKSWMARNMLEKVVGIDAYRPVPGVFRVSR